MFSMTITLKSVEYSQRMSEETDCFIAVVCLDGVPAMQVENTGKGGCNSYNPLKGQPIDKFREQLARFEQYVADRKPADAKHWHASLEMDCIIGDALTRHLRVKDYQKLARASLVLLKGKDVYTVKIPGRKPDTLSIAERDHYTNRFNDGVILNFLPGTEGLERFLALADSK